MKHRGPPSDTCCPLRGLPSTHTTLNLARMIGFLEEEEALRREGGRKGLKKNKKREGFQKGRKGDGRRIDRVKKR